MKKLVVVCLILCFAALQGSAQKLSFVKKDNIAGLGIGFGGNIYSGYYGSGIKRIPAISLYYERCIKDNLWDEKSSLGIGGLLGYASAKWEESAYGTKYGWKSSNIIIGARGVLHYAFLDKLDTYTGLMLGYNVVSFKWTGTNASWLGSGAASEFTWAWFIGARYYFTDSFAAFAELGYGVAILNLGVSLKF